MNKQFVIAGASLAVVSAILLARKTQTSIQSKRIGSRSGRHPAGSLQTSSAGIAFIKQAEGYEPKPYPDGPGYSIGYGHQLLAGEDWSYISPGDATALLLADLPKYEGFVQRNVTAPLTQNEFDALVSWAYNLGDRPNSTLYKKLNALDYMGAANQFAVWRMADGKVHDGLVKRRAREKTLFLAEAPATAAQAAALAGGDLSAVA